MKFKINDQVIVTIGKDKGKKSKITKVFPNQNKVTVEGVNLFVKHVKPMPTINREGERTVQERPLDTAKIAILNEKGERDRVGYKAQADGKKVRIFKKTGSLIKTNELTEKPKVKTKTKSVTTKKATKAKK